MSKLITELATEIHSSNPNYSSEEISNRIVTVIENELLPSVIEKLPLPSLPSPIELRIQKFRRQRVRGKKDVAELQKRINFIQELERMRKSYYLSDSTFHELKITEPNAFIQKHIIFPFRSLKEERERALPETDTISPKLEPLSFLDVSEKRTGKSSEPVIFSSEVMKRIASDPNYEKIIASVECRIRERFKTIPRIAFNFSQRRDIEDPNRKKTVIHVKIPDSIFTEKMNYWLRIEFEVRKAIKSLDVTEAERKSINRNIVTHIESE